MRNNIIFVLSVILIVLINWADVHYFGTFDTNRFSVYVNQGVHFLCMGLVGLIGYYNLKNKEKWLQSFWPALYIAAFAVVVVLYAIFYLSTGVLSTSWKAAPAEIRNVFTSPLPLLVFALIRSVLNNFNRVSNQRS